MRFTVRQGIASAQAALSVFHTSTADEALRVYLARRTSVPPTYVSNAIHDFIQSLVVSGVWDLMDFCILPTDTAQGSQLNLVGANGDLTAYNSPAFVPFHGFMGDAATSYLTQVGMSSSNIRESLNDSHLGLFVRTANTNSGGYDIYRGGGTTMRRSATTARYVMALQDSSTAYITPASLIGHFVTTRNNATTHSPYYNGANQGDVSVASTTWSSGLNVFKAGSSSFSNAEIGCVHSGRSLTAAQVQTLYQSRVNYYNAVGAS